MKLKYFMVHVQNDLLFQSQKISKNCFHFNSRNNNNHVYVNLL